MLAGLTCATDMPAVGSSLPLVGQEVTVGPAPGVYPLGSEGWGLADPWWSRARMEVERPCSSRDRARWIAGAVPCWRVAAAGEACWLSGRIVSRAEIVAVTERPCSVMSPRAARRAGVGSAPGGRGSRRRMLVRTAATVPEAGLGLSCRPRAGRRAHECANLTGSRSVSRIWPRPGRPDVALSDTAVTSPAFSRLTV